MHELIQKQRKAIDHFYEQIDISQLETLVGLCLGVEGLIVFTGVGKSGIIAEKIAMTFASTGTRAIYLSPTNFLHGDLGVLKKEDLVVFLSKSGETEELLELISFLRKKQVRLAALISNPESRLARYVDCFVHLPVERELCLFDLAPTTSTAVQLLAGDVLAVAIMKKKAVTLQEYALNHPAGSIGKKTSMTVEDLMVKDEGIPFAGEEYCLADVLLNLTEKKCGCVVVVDSLKNMRGIFTDGDLRRALQTHGADVLQKEVANLMTKTPLTSARGQLAWDALKIMQSNPKRWISVLPVLEEGRVVGLLRMHDIIQAGII